MKIKGKKIVITGASGFVGSNAVHYFHNRGANVTAIVSSQATPEIINRQLGKIKKKITIKKLDLLSPADALLATKGQDIVLHFAAIDGNAEFKKTHSAEIFSKNIRMNLNMLEAAVTNSVKKFLLMSSADIYPSSAHKRITEESSVDISLNKNIDGYKLAKWSTELAAEAFQKQYGLDILIMRPSNLYGPRDEFQNAARMRIIPSIIKKIHETNEPIILWGNKKQLRSFLFIDDFLVICQKFLEDPRNFKLLNVASNQTISLENLAKKIISASGKQRKILINKHINTGNVSRKFNLSHLGVLMPKFTETAIEVGLQRTIEYYKKIRESN